MVNKKEPERVLFCLESILRDIEELNYEEYFAILYLNQTADAVLRFNKDTMGVPVAACSISLFLHLA